MPRAEKFFSVTSIVYSKKYLFSHYPWLTTHFHLGNLFTVINITTISTKQCNIHIMDNIYFPLSELQGNLLVTYTPHKRLVEYVTQ